MDFKGGVERRISEMNLKGKGQETPMVLGRYLLRISCTPNLTRLKHETDS